MNKDRGLRFPRLKYKDDGRRKLLEEDIKNIRKRFASGENCFKLADDFNVTVSTIRYWTNEDYRKNVINAFNFRNKMYPRDKDIMLEASKKSRNKHKNRIKVYSKKYHQKVWNKDFEQTEKCKKACKKYRNTHKKKMIDLNNLWVENHKKKCIDCGKEICYKALRCKSCAVKLVRKLKVMEVKQEAMQSEGHSSQEVK